MVTKKWNGFTLDEKPYGFMIYRTNSNRVAVSFNADADEFYIQTDIEAEEEAEASRCKGIYALPGFTPKLIDRKGLIENVARALLKEQGYFHGPHKRNKKRTPKTVEDLRKNPKTKGAAWKIQDYLIKKYRSYIAKEVLRQWDRIIQTHVPDRVLLAHKHIFRTMGPRRYSDIINSLRQDVVYHNFRKFLINTSTTTIEDCLNHYAWPHAMAFDPSRHEANWRHTWIGRRIYDNEYKYHLATINSLPRNAPTQLVKVFFDSNIKRPLFTKLDFTFHTLVNLGFDNWIDLAHHSVHFDYNYLELANIKVDSSHLEYRFGLPQLRTMPIDEITENNCEVHQHLRNLSAEDVRKLAKIFGKRLKTLPIPAHISRFVRQPRLNFSSRKYGHIFDMMVYLSSSPVTLNGNLEDYVNRVFNYHQSRRLLEAIEK